MAMDVVIGLVDAQLVGRAVLAVGLIWLKRAVNLDPMRREGARMREMPLKRTTARRIRRSRKWIARLDVYQASAPGVFYLKRFSAVNIWGKLRSRGSCVNLCAEP